METIINSQVKGSDPSTVEELILDKFRGPQITEHDSQLLSKFPSLEILSLNYCGLKSLTNFPVLPSLIKLELSDNKLKSGLQILSTLSSLTQLSLAGNQISDIQDLAPLTELQHLVTLDLFGNPLTEAEGYREKVFQMFKNLQVLDGCDKNGEEVSVASEEESEEEDDDEDVSDLLDDEEESPIKRKRSGESSEECKKVSADLDR